MSEAIFRPSARVVVADDRDRVLLYRGRTGPGAHAWFTPGGGMRAGESPAVAAARELAEEIGHRVAPGALGPVVATASGHWTSDDGVLYRYTDSFFFLRAPALEVDASGMEELERGLIDGFRWWTLPELRATGEEVRPAGLIRLLPRLLGGELPAGPVVLT